MAGKKISVAIISQARMSSTRLHGKIFKEIGGKPLLQYHIERLRQSGLNIIIATTSNSVDDKVCAFAEKQKILFTRGSETNVLERYYEAAKKFDLDVIV